MALLLGCGSPPQAQPAPPTPIPAPPESTSSPTNQRAPSRQARLDRVYPGETYLGDDHRKSFPRRGFFRTNYPIQWSESSPPATDNEDELKAPAPLESPEELVVVERRPQHLRIVAESRGVRFTGYFPRAAFALAVSETATLHAAGQPSTEKSGSIRIKPGFTLPPSTLRRERIQIDQSIDTVPLTGWIEGDRVDHAYAPLTLKRPNEGVTIAKGTALLATPRGPALAKLTEDLLGFGRVTDTKTQLSRISIQTEHLMLDVWVSTASLSEGRGGFGHRSHSRGSFYGTWIYHDTLLYAAPGGETIGRVFEHRGHLYVGKPKNGFATASPVSLVGAGQPQAWISAAAIERSAALESVRDQRIHLKSVAASDATTERSARDVATRSIRWLQYCYDDALTSDSTLAGDITFQFAFPEKLKVTHPKAKEESALGTLVDCAIRWMRGSQSKPSKATAQVTLSFETGASIVAREKR